MKKEQFKNNIKTEILKHGLDMKTTIMQYLKILQDNNIKETITQTEIRIDQSDNYYFIWLYSQQENGEIIDLQYKYNDCKAWTQKAVFNKNTKSVLKALYTEKAQTSPKKDHKPKEGYYITRALNNRPSYLLSLKNSDFVEFVAVRFFDERPIFHTFNINENKKTEHSNFLNISYFMWADESTRKDAHEIYAIYNKNMSEYIKTCEEIKTKQNQRLFFKGYLKTQKRYKYNEFDFNELDDNFCMSLWGVAHVFKDTEENEKTTCNYLTFKGEKIYHYCDTRKELFYNFLVDKNGFFKLDKIVSLKKRTERLKREREQARKEQITKAWNESDHTQQAEEIAKYLENLKTMILNYTIFDRLLNNNNFDILKTLRELYLSFNKQLNFSNYTNIDEWEKRKAEKVAEYEFYMCAISKGVFNRLACFHHYEKTETGYKMKDTEKDPYWRNPERYIQEF